MNYTCNDINEKALYVLREANDGKFYTEYLSIQIDDNLSNSIKKMQDNMQERTKDENLSKQEIYNIKKQMILDYWEDIQKNHSYLFGYRNYTPYISSSYVSGYGLSKDFPMKFLPFSDESNEVRIEKTGCKNGTTIKEIFPDDFFHSYFIEQTYKKCIDDKNIKTYSHRRIGHTTYDFELNKIFSVKIKTNFGYGYANHFLVTLIYDGIQIIPYSRLVVYRKANYMELIRHTWEFGIRDDSWELVFDMVRDACNNYKQGEKNYFIKKYFVDELDKLTNKLSEYLNINEFELSENKFDCNIVRNEKMQKVQLYGFPLIIFRGEKVVGAVSFVENIKKINKILSTQIYIDVIINCCAKVLFQFNNAINELNPIIEKLKNTYNQECEKRERLEARCKEIEPEMEIYSILEKEIRDEIFESTPSNENIDYQEKIDLVNKEMLKKHPNWEKTKEEYKQRKNEFEGQKKICSDKYSEIYTHESYLSQVSKYRNEICLFLENK